VIVEGPEETPFEISCLKGVERDLKLRDTRKPIRRSLAYGLTMATPIHKDPGDKNETEPESKE
jgi:hypothetical protein